MQKELGHAEVTQLDVDTEMDQSGKYGTVLTLVTMSSKPSRQLCNIASSSGCIRCGQLLEEWEVDLCEGCWLLTVR